MIERRVDVFLESPIPFDELYQARITLRDGDLEVHTASLEHLLRMKRKIQPPREHDLFDIRILEKLIAERRDT